MKQPLLKRWVKFIAMIAGAVIFLFFLNKIMSVHTLSQNLFSQQTIFVKTINVNEEKNIQDKQISQNKPYTKKPDKKISTKTVSVPSQKKSEIPKLFMSQIQVGDEKSARNEFVKVCNYGSPTSFLGVSLRKKSSSGNEEKLLGEQWGKKQLDEGECVCVGNAEANVVELLFVRWAKSHALAEKNNTLLLYFGDTLLDEVFWSSIPKGKSIVRNTTTSAWTISE